MLLDASRLTALAFRVLRGTFVRVCLRAGVNEVSLTLRLLIAAAVPAMLVAYVTRAGLTYSNDQRFVRAQTSLGGNQIKLPLTPFASFTQTAVVDSAAFSGTCHGEASQNSNLSASGIAASGSGTPTAGVTDGSSLVFGATGSSVFKVSFTSDSDGILDVQGQFAGSGQGNFSAAFVLELSAESMPLFSSTTGGSFDVSSLIFAGVTYTLEVSATGSAFAFFIINPVAASANASFTFTATTRAATCAGDLNADGFVDDVDFTIFAAAYNLLDCADPVMTPGCPADLNADGVVDDTDFTLFAPAYDALLCA